MENFQPKYPKTDHNVWKTMLFLYINSAENPDSCVRLCDHQSECMVRESDLPLQTDRLIALLAPGCQCSISVISMLLTLNL